MKVPTTRLLLVTEIRDGKPSHRKSLARNLLVWSDLTFGPLLQGQMRTAKLKSAYNLFIIGPRGLEIMGWKCICVVRFDHGPLLQGRTRILHL